MLADMDSKSDSPVKTVGSAQLLSNQQPSAENDMTVGSLKVSPREEVLFYMEDEISLDEAIEADMLNIRENMLSEDQLEGGL